jgi:hypothetical protein
MVLVISFSLQFFLFPKVLLTLLAEKLVLFEADFFWLIIDIDDIADI